VHGGSAAQEGLAEAHRSVLSNVLATPIQELLEDVEKSSESAGCPRKSMPARWRNGDHLCCPRGPVQVRNSTSSQCFKSW